MVLADQAAPLRASCKGGGPQEDAVGLHPGGTAAVRVQQALQAAQARPGAGDKEGELGTCQLPAATKLYARAPLCPAAH